MKLAMMTLGCPDWDLPTICSRACEYGFDGIDFRGVGDEIDVTRLPAFTKDAAVTRRMLADHGLVVSGISSSIHICNAAREADNLEEARRTIDVALAVGAANVRLFGYGDPHRVGYSAAAAVGQAQVEAILGLPNARQLSWNLETHDDWVKAEHFKPLLDRVPDQAFGILWDIGHTLRVSDDTPEQTLAAIGDRLRYVHVKDAVRAPHHPHVMEDGWRYVLPGQGELQLAEAVHIARRSGFDGWIGFEHEKRWHRDLEAPEVAFPAFVEWANSILN